MHLGWSLIAVNCVLIGASLIELRWQPALDLRDVLSGKSNVEGATLQRATYSSSDATRSVAVGKVHDLREASYFAPTATLVPPAPVGTGVGPDSGWVPLNPPVQLKRVVSRAIGQTTSGYEADGGTEGILSQTTEPYPQRQFRTSTAFYVRVDPAAPGSSLSQDGQRATVAGYVASDDPNEAEVQVSMEKDESTGSDSKAGSQLHAGDPSRWGGLSYEEELFRTKWGWNAFAEVQRLATEKTGASR